MRIQIVEYFPNGEPRVFLKHVEPEVGAWYCGMIESKNGYLPGELAEYRGKGEFIGGREFFHGRSKTPEAIDMSKYDYIRLHEV